METRTHLTKEKIAEHLKSKVVKVLIERSVALVCWFVIFAAVACIAYLLLDSAWALVVLVVPFIWYACIIYVSVVKLRKIKMGAFSIVEDKLDGIDECRRRYGLFASLLYPAIATGGKHGKIFQFARYGEYMIANDGSVIQYSNADDVFYLVVYNSDPQKPVAIYNTKLYEWKGE